MTKNDNLTHTKVADGHGPIPVSVDNSLVDVTKHRWALSDGCEYQCVICLADDPLTMVAASSVLHDQHREIAAHIVQLHNMLIAAQESADRGTGPVTFFQALKMRVLAAFEVHR